MLDTFTISKTLARAPDERYLLELDWKQVLFDSRGNCIKYTWSEKGSSKPRLTLTKRLDGWWTLRAEVSLGSWLYGSNLHLTDENDLPHGLNALSKFVESKTGVVFDARTERVTRVDFTRDFKIDECLIVPMIERFSKITLPKYNRQPINETTACLRNAGAKRTKEYKIYSKYHERLKNTKDPQEQENAKGILRLEVALWNDAVKQLADSLKLPDHRANNILRKEVAENVIQKAMRLFEIEKVLAGEIANILKLFENVSHKTSKDLIYYLVLREKFGEGFYKNPIFKLSKRTCQRRWKKCRELGVLALE